MKGSQTTFKAYFLNRLIGKAKELLGSSDSNGKQVCVNGLAVAFLKDSRQIELVDIEFGTQIVQGDFLCVVCIQISFYENNGYICILHSRE